jgi:hypothetical protein
MWKPRRLTTLWHPLPVTRRALHQFTYGMCDHHFSCPTHTEPELCGSLQNQDCKLPPVHILQRGTAIICVHCFGINDLRQEVGRQTVRPESDGEGLHAVVHRLWRM